jgi:hypothetical protein
MTDPTRWSDAGDAASPTEQMLVRAGQDLAMPSAEKLGLWNRIQVALAHTAALPATTQAATVGSGSLLVLKGAKTLGVLAVLSGLAAGGYQWTRRPQLRAPIESVRSTPSASAAHETNAAPEPVPGSVRIEVPGSAPMATRTAPVSRVSLLGEESLAVVAARQALRAGDANKTLHLLDLAQQRFKKGALTEEREALTIEALAKAGQSARAEARAQAFLTNYPRSPHAADVQRFIAK